ncbi:MAG: class flavin-dependent oxidoreductase [Thermomicrobiales bacterium]|nr:class flavin-dependent oxidoreductase [Thermomicrobiales bacterium]
MALLGRDDPQNAPFRGEPEEITDILLEFAREGISEIQLVLMPNTLEGIEAFAPILEMLDRA